MKLQTIRFKFRCTAFGYAYYDCITPECTFEVRHGNGVDCLFTKDNPPIEPHWSGEITLAISEAWADHCRQEAEQYEAWKAAHADLLAV